ncbi:hypothetical protein ACFRJ9_15950 [Paenarthrobacter sp. NPDC056912]|uniref:hypothetical protein n=1 Tax=Paenarthrobacter sp. NPDC056912 TaxID=3345965 RepID=UPI00366A82D8
MEPSTYWTMIAAIATAVSAVATMASAVVIAIQAVLTRKALIEAKRSADASERAVTVANASLELAREQAQQSEVMTAEAIRARMETNAPSVFFTLDRDENGPKACAYARSDSYDDPVFSVVEPGAVFQKGPDDSSWLFAIFRVRFENAGTQPLAVNPGLGFAHLSNAVLTRRQSHIELSVSNSSHSFLAVGCRVSDWIRATHAPDRARIVVASSAWSVDVGGETGVLVRQPLRIEGTLLESGPGEGNYSLRSLGPDPMQNYPSRLVMDKQKRDYVVGWDAIGNPRLLPTPEIPTEAFN